MEPKPILILSNLPNDVQLDDIKKLFVDHNVVQAIMENKDNIPIGHVELTNFEQILSFLSSREKFYINDKQIDIDLLQTVTGNEITDLSSKIDNKTEVKSTLSVIEPVQRSIEINQCDTLLESPMMTTNTTTVATATALKNDEKKLQEEKLRNEVLEKMLNNFEIDDAHHDLLQSFINEIQWKPKNRNITNVNKVVEHVRPSLSTPTLSNATSKENITSNSTIVSPAAITNNHIVPFTCKTPITSYKYHSLVHENPPFVAHLTNLPSDAKIDDVFKIFPKNVIERVVMPTLPHNPKRILGFAYVEFSKREDLLAALEIDDPEINDIEIQINYYKREIPKQGEDVYEKKLHTSNVIQDNQSVQQTRNTGINEQKQSIITGGTPINVSTNATPTTSSNNSSTKQNNEIYQIKLNNIHSNTLDSELKNYVKVFGNINYPIEIVREFAGSKTGFVNLQTLEDVKRTVTAINNAGLSVYGEYIENKSPQICENKMNQSDNQKKLQTKSNAISSNIIANPPFIIALYKTPQISDSEIRHLFSDFKIVSIKESSTRKFIEFSTCEELTRVLNSKWCIGSTQLRIEIGNRTKENYPIGQKQTPSYKMDLRNFDRNCSSSNSAKIERNVRNQDSNKVPNGRENFKSKTPIVFKKPYQSIGKKEYSMMLTNLPGMNNPILNDNFAIQNIIANHGKIKYPIKIDRYNGKVYAYLHTITDLQYVVMVINNNNLGIKAEINEEQRENVTIPEQSKTINPSTNFEIKPSTNFDITPITSNQMQATKTTTVSTTSVVIQTSNEFNKCDGQSCIKCLKLANLKCERCFRYYCSADCQQVDWPYHSVICMPMPKLIDASVPTNKNIACLLSKEQINQIQNKSASRNDQDDRRTRAIQSRRSAEFRKRRYAEMKRKEDQNREAEEKRKKDEKLKEDVKRMEEEKRTEDQKREAEEKRKKDEKRKEDEKRMEEEKRKEVQKREAEVKRKENEKRMQEQRLRQDKLEAEACKLREDETRKLREVVEQLQREIESQRLAINEQKKIEEKERYSKEYIERLFEEKMMHILKEAKDKTNEPKSKEITGNEEIITRVKAALGAIPKSMDHTDNQEKSIALDKNPIEIENKRRDAELKMQQENERKRDEENEKKRQEEDLSMRKNENEYLEKIMLLLKNVKVGTNVPATESKQITADTEISVGLEAVELTDAIVKSDEEVSTRTTTTTTTNGVTTDDEQLQSVLRPNNETVSSIELAKIKETLRVLEEEQHKREMDKLKQIECSKEMALADEMKCRDNPEYLREMQLKQLQENHEIEQLREKLVLDEMERNEHRRQLIERIRGIRRDSQDTQKNVNIPIPLNDGYQQGYIPQTNEIVVITAVLSAKLLVIRSDNDDKAYQELLDKIRRFSEHTFPLNAKPIIGDMVLVNCKSNYNSDYYRAIVMKFVDETKLFVVSIDYGYFKLVKIGDLRFIDPALKNYKRYATQVTLSGIDHFLSDDKTLIIKNYLQTLMNDGKRLKITLQEPFNTSIGTCELFIADTMESINDSIIKLSEK